MSSVSPVFDLKLKDGPRNLVNLRDVQVLNSDETFASSKRLSNVPVERYNIARGHILQSLYD